MPDSTLDPDDIARKTFVAGFRGYEQQEVRAYLHDLSQQIRRLQSSLFETEARVAELQPLAAQRDAPIDPARLSELVGEETARVLTAAREAADEIKAKAEEAASRIVKEATNEAKSLRQAADNDARELRDEAASVLERRSAEAEEAATEILARAERDAETRREDAEADHRRVTEEAERLLAEAEEEAKRVIGEAKAHGREMVGEARALRQRLLEDLSRRRHAAREQIERLNAGRERLLTAYSTVRRTLDEATSELTVVVGEAKAAADTAALRVQDEEPATIEEIEAELAAATDAGLPVLDWNGDSPFEAGESDGESADDADEPSLEPEKDDADLGEVESEPSGPEPTESTAELPEIDPESIEAGPVEDPPQPIVMPRRGPKRRLLRREQPPESSLLPPAELVPLTEAHEVEGVRVVGSPSSEASTTADHESPESRTVDEAGDEGATGKEVEDALDGSAEPAPTERVDEIFARIRAERAADSDPDSDTDSEASSVDEDTVDEDDTVEDSTADEGDPADESDSVDDDTVDEDDTVDPDKRLALRAMSQRDEILAPLGKELAKRLKRALADEQNELLDAIRRANDDDVLAHLPDHRAHASAYVTVAGSVLSEAAAAAVEATGSGEVPDTAQVAARMADAICRPLRDRFENAREQADGDPDELDTRLRACYREWKTTVLVEAGADALVAAWSAGVVAATPEVCGLRWLIAPGAPPCPDAEDNALEGVVAAGSPFPTGDLAPPAHPGCRCLVVQVSE